MSISGSLESLPELFRLIDRDAKSGRSIVQVTKECKIGSDKTIYYIWFQKGYLIAVSNCLNYRGLIDLIGDRLNIKSSSKLIKFLKNKFLGKSGIT